MVFWIGILVGAIFAYFAIKTGFYETWAFTFNIVISIYLAVFVGPVIADIVPIAGGTLYNDALCMVVVATGAFLILHGISYIFITGRFSVSLPKIFDIFGAGFLGLLAGFLVWSFVILFIYITPISQNSFVKTIGFGSQFEQVGAPYICWWCNLVNGIVSAKDNTYTAEYIISDLSKKVKDKEPEKQAEPNQPAEPNPDKSGSASPNSLSQASHQRLTAGLVEDEVFDLLAGQIKRSESRSGGTSQ